MMLNLWFLDPLILILLGHKETEQLGQNTAFVHAEPPEKGYERPRE